jgi:hypothetical protein
MICDKRSLSKTSFCYFVRKGGMNDDVRPIVSDHNVSVGGTVDCTITF